MSQTISFEVTTGERVLISRIVSRAAALWRAEGYEIKRMDMQMDIAATHANGCPLDLQRLLDFDDFNFVHDISGIAHCLDRVTAKLDDRFRPRCALAVVSDAA